MISTLLYIWHKFTYTWFFTLSHTHTWSICYLHYIHRKNGNIFISYARKKENNNFDLLQLTGTLLGKESTTSSYEESKQNKKSCCCKDWKTKLKIELWIHSSQRCNIFTDFSILAYSFYHRNLIFIPLAYMLYLTTSHSGIKDMIFFKPVNGQPRKILQCLVKSTMRVYFYYWEIYYQSDCHTANTIFQIQNARSF